eukprot:1159895-Pelagomonas_calceolata.AAC.1
MHQAASCVHLVIFQSQPPASVKQETVTHTHTHTHTPESTCPPDCCRASALYSTLLQNRGRCCAQATTAAAPCHTGTALQVAM